MNGVGTVAGVGLASGVEEGGSAVGVGEADTAGVEVAGGAVAVMNASTGVAVGTAEVAVRCGLPCGVGVGMDGGVGIGRSGEIVRGVGAAGAAVQAAATAITNAVIRAATEWRDGKSMKVV